MTELFNSHEALPEGPDGTFATGWLVRFQRGPVSGAADGATVVAGEAGRLLLLAPDSGAPGTAVEDGVGVVFWGDLDNAATLQAANPATTAGQAADTLSASARLVLAAYRRHGSELARALAGRHAFILYDARGDLLLAARDRVGLVPLFTRETGSGIEFVVAMEAFELSPAGRPAINTDLAAAYLARVRMNLAETFLAGVERVPPGHMLSLEEGRPEVRRHWLPPPVGAGAEWIREDELPRFGELLDAAVSRPLGRGRGGIFLSGGLDSVSVAAAAVDHSRRHGFEPPIALSLLFPGAVSEAGTQRGVARSLGLEFVALDFDEALEGKGLLRSGLELSTKLAAPQQNAWTPAYDGLTAAGRARGISNVLTGGGGDEWLTVTPLIAADYLARGEFGALVAYLGVLGRSLNLKRRHLYRNVLWTNGARPLLHGAAARARARYLPASVVRRRQQELAARLAALPAWVAPAAAVRQGLERRLHDIFSGAIGPQDPGPGGRYFREMRVTLNHPLFALDVEEIFEDGQRNRAPHWDVYWDADLIEFIYRVPPSLLNQGGRSKGLVRADVARRFPDFGFATQRKLVSRDFFVGRFYDELDDLLPIWGVPEALGELGIVEPMSVRAEIDEAKRVRDATEVDSIWRLMSLEAWARSRV